jgi:peroxiredoxin Q/BCP
MALKVGDRAPDLTLPSADGKNVSLADFRGKKTVVLYFYPKDETPGCTAEACEFRDNHGAFMKAGAEVIGVSADSVASHGKFAEHHSLPFTLLSDEHGTARRAYDVKKVLGLLPGRVTFVIDREGVIRHVFDSALRMGAHVTTALEIVKKLEGASASG